MIPIYCRSSTLTVSVVDIATAIENELYVNHVEIASASDVAAATDYTLTVLETAGAIDVASYEDVGPVRAVTDIVSASETTSYSLDGDISDTDVATATDAAAAYIS